MRFFKWVSGTLFLLALAATALAQSSVGNVTFVKGEVKVNGKSVEVTTAVKPGDVVETVEGSCTLLLGKESVVHLGKNSKMVVTEYASKATGEEATLDLNYGISRALIKKTESKRKRFLIRTKSAVMGVRGTHVYVAAPADGGPAQFLTLEGQADLTLEGTGSQPKIQELKTGEMLSVSPSESGGQSPEVKAQNVNAGEMKQMADAVAPPPDVIHTPAQAEKGKGGFGPGKGPGGSFFEGFNQPPKPQQDPVADALVAVKMNVSLKKVNQ